MENFTRYKHWFQYNDGSLVPDSTLVIVQFRNVYEWAEGMRAKPHHSTDHLDLDWKTFLTRPWTTKRFGIDLEMKNKTGRVCHQNFRYDEVVSCVEKPLPRKVWEDLHGRVRWENNRPFYELRHDGSGRPYSSILDMRADKIRNMLEIRNFDNVRDMWTYQYEELVEQGTDALVRRVEKETGLKANCMAYPPQNRTHRRLDEDFVQYVREHVNWEAEKLIGYKKQ